MGVLDQYTPEAKSGGVLGAFTPDAVKSTAKPNPKPKKNVFVRAAESIGDVLFGDPEEEAKAKKSTKRAGGGTAIGPAKPQVASKRRVEIQELVATKAYNSGTAKLNPQLLEQAIKNLKPEEQAYARYYAQESEKLREPSGREVLATGLIGTVSVPTKTAFKAAETLISQGGKRAVAGKILQTAAKVGDKAEKAKGIKGAAARTAHRGVTGAAENVAFEAAVRPGEVLQHPEQLVGAAVIGGGMKAGIGGGIDLLGARAAKAKPQQAAAAKESVSIPRGINEPDAAAAQKGLTQWAYDFFDNGEKAALERMKQRRTAGGTSGRLQSGIDPLDLVDMSIIGAMKIGKGAVKFADWSAEMVRDFGEDIRPHLKGMWDQANDYYQKNLVPAVERLASKDQPADMSRPPVKNFPEGPGGKEPPPAAKAVEPVPGEPKPGPEYAGNINLDRIDTPRDVKDRILQAADEIKLSPKFTERTGKISWEQTEKAAQDMGLTPQDMKKILPGKAYNAETILALRDLHTHHAERLKAAEAAYAQSGGSVEAKAAALQALAEYESVHQSLRGATAEAGRALNIYKNIAAARRAVHGGEFSFRDLAIDKLEDLFGGKALSEEILAEIAKIPADDYTALARLVRKYRDFKPGEKIEAYTFANILSGVSTHLMNSISNTLWAAEQVVTKAASVPFEAVLSKVHGRPQEYHLRALPAAVVGYKTGVRQGVRRAIYILKEGLDIEQAMKMEVGNQYQFPGGLKNPWNWPGRALSAADAVAKEMARASEIGWQATNTALKEGLNGTARSKRIRELIENPTKEMAEKADHFAGVSTFTDPMHPKVRQALAGLNWAIDQDTPIVGKALEGLRPLRFIMKFVQVPAKITARSLEYTPLSFAKAFDKSPEASMAMAKASIGTALFVYAADLAADGLLTGAAPENPKDRDAFYRSGKQPFSAKIGDKWVPYNRLGPFSAPLAAMAGWYSKYTETGDLPETTKIARAAGEVGSALLLEASYLNSLSALVDAIEDPERYADRFFSNIASQFVPLAGMQRNINYAMDPNIRDTRRYADSGPVEPMVDQVKSFIPGMAQQLPERLDAFGEPVERQGRTGAFGFVPLGPSEDKSSEAEKYAIEHDLWPAIPKKVIEVDGDKRNLSRDQYQAMLRKVGQAQKNALFEIHKQMKDHPEWFAGMPEEGRVELIRDYMQEARNLATEQFRETLRK
jgi:hypothetical protein